MQVDPATESEQLSSVSAATALPGRYDAFISYAWDPPEASGSAPSSQRVSDATIARRLRHSMLSMGTARTRRSDLSIYLDKWEQRPTAKLWEGGILDNVASSRFLILLCSPRSATSPGVKREVEYWLNSGKSLDTILVVLLSGSLDEALPEPLRIRRANDGYDPLYIDLRWVEHEGDLDHRKSARYQDDVATLVASLRDVPKDTIIGEELALRVRSIRVQRGFITGLSFLLVLALVLGGFAVWQRERARREATIAESRALAAAAGNALSSRLDLAQLLAVQAYKKDANPQTRQALFQAATVSPHLVRYWHADAPISALTASNDGKSVVAGSSAGVVTRWTVQGNRQESVLTLDQDITSIAVSRDGTKIAAADGRTAVFLDSASGGQQIVPTDIAEPRTIGLSPSGRWLAVTGSNPESPSEDGTELVLLDQRQGKSSTLSVRLEPTHILFPDESEVVAINQDTGTWERIDLRTKQVTTRGGTQTGVHYYASAVSSDAAYFSFTNASTTVPLWRINDRAGSREPDRVAVAPGRYPEALAISSGGHQVAVADNGVIHVADTASGGSTPPTETLELSGNASVNANGLQFLADGQQLISASGSSLALWDTRQPSRIGLQSRPPLTQTCNACPGPKLNLSPDGQYVAFYGGMFAIVVQPLHSAKGGATQGITLSSGTDTGDDLRWSPDSRQLIMRAPERGAVEVRTEGANPRLLQSVEVPPDSSHEVLVQWRLDAPTILLVHKDSPKLRDANEERVGKLMQAALQSHPHQESEPRRGVLSPDQSTFASIVDQDVWLVNGASGALNVVTVGDAANVTFSKDRLLIGRMSGAIELRSLDGSLIASIPGSPRAARLLVAASDGDFAARLRDDGLVEVIHLPEAQVLGTLEKQAMVTYGLSPGLTFIGNGSRLIVARPDENSNPLGFLHDYDISVDAWLKAACRAAGRDLTADEWRQFVNDNVPEDLRCGYE